MMANFFLFFLFFLLEVGCRVHVRSYLVGDVCGGIL